MSSMIAGSAKTLGTSMLPARAPTAAIEDVAATRRQGDLGGVLALVHLVQVHIVGTLGLPAHQPRNPRLMPSSPTHRASSAITVRRVRRGLAAPDRPASETVFFGLLIGWLGHGFVAPPG